MSFSSVWKKIKQSKSFKPSRIIIPPENISPELTNNNPFQRHQQYFSISINELYLVNGREWFTTWEPFVFIASQFLYKNKMHTVPYFVGRKMLEGKVESVPEGMIFENTKVAGLHPYRGGDFSVSVVLGRAKNNDYLKKTLKIMENAAKTYIDGFGTAVLPYLKVANIVVDAYEELLDSNDIEPLIGHSMMFQPDTQGGLHPGYFALINEAEDKIDPSRFFIIDGKLYKGKTKEKAKLYREKDFVLYSILASKHRSDVELLPYYEEFIKIQEFIAGMGFSIENENMKKINAKLFALLDRVYMSPDLIRSQVEEQMQEFRSSLKKMIDQRRPLAGRNPTETKPDERDEWEKKMDAELMDILNF
ncbi:MAG: hypothetical protein R8P61_04670 [Bacteroidia bacterium]|nr:hypothetical protein [Bacteroidia bacterium]